MITETIYEADDLVPGTCKSCNEKTDIVPAEGMCPDCIEDIKFYEHTMKGV